MIQSLSIEFTLSTHIQLTMTAQGLSIVVGALHSKMNWLSLLPFPEFFIPLSVNSSSPLLYSEDNSLRKQFCNNDVCGNFARGSGSD